MMPKDWNALENAFRQCEDDKAFVKIPKESCVDFVKEAYSDIASAEDELGKSDKWAIVKAYQALFSMCNAVLIGRLGVYSKDHGCVLIALMREKLIPETIAAKLGGILRRKDENAGNTELFDRISDIRVTRNKYLYFPETQRKIKASPKAIIGEVKEIIEALAEVE